MLPQIIYVIYVILTSILSVFWANRCVANPKRIYKSFRGKFTTIEFKPMKDISLEEYIFLYPKTPSTAVAAILTELDRQGKIELMTIKEKAGRRVIISVKEPKALTDGECSFLYAIKQYQFDTRWKEIKHFIHVFFANDSRLPTPKLLFSSEEINSVRNEEKPWSIFFRSDSILERNPIGYLFLGDEIRGSLNAKGMYRKIDRKQRRKEDLIINLALVLPLFFSITGIFVSAFVYQRLGIPSPFYYTGAESPASIAIFGLIVLLIPLITGLILDRQLNLAREYRYYTPKALDVLHYYDGLKEYMKKVEIDKITFLQDKEKSDFLELTPYAILFGLEKKWSKKFRFALYN